MTRSFCASLHLLSFKFVCTNIYLHARGTHTDTPQQCVRQRNWAKTLRESAQRLPCCLIVLRLIVDIRRSRLQFNMVPVQKSINRIRVCYCLDSLLIAKTTQLECPIQQQTFEKCAHIATTFVV